MTQYVTTSEELKSVADTIRTKTKTSENLIWPEGYNSAINSISVSGPAPVIKPLEVKQNGSYSTPNGVVGYNPITVNCPVPKEEQSKTTSTVANGQVIVKPDNGKVLSQAIVNINVPERKPEETKTVEYTSNGKYTINPSTSDKVITSASVSVNVPSDQKPEVAGNEIIKVNGKKTFTPPQGNVFNSFTVETQVPDIPAVIQPLKIIKNGLTQIPKGVDGFGPIEVSVPSDKKPEQEYNKTYTSNGTYNITPQAGNVITGGTIKVQTPGPKVEQAKTVDATKNGPVVVTPDGNKVLNKVTVNVSVPSDKKPEIAGNETIKTNGQKTYTPTAGSVYSSFTVNVQTPEPKPEESKTVTVNQNGTTEVFPTNGKVMTKVTITTNTPAPKAEQTKALDITANGSYDITPDGGKVLSKATARVNIPYSTLYTGVEAPSNSLGIDGDIYFQK